MSFLSKLNLDYDELLIESSNNDEYKYSDFVKDMVEIEKTIHENNIEYLKTKNLYAIESLLESTAPEKKKETFDAIDDEHKKSAHNAYTTIKQSYVKALTSIYTTTSKAFAKIDKVVKECEQNVIKNSLVYKNETDSNNSNDIPVGFFEVKTYEKIFTYPKCVPLMGSFLNEYKLEKNKLDKKKLYEYYQSAILGDRSIISIDTLNKKKEIIIKNLDTLIKEMDKRKSEIKKIIDTKVPDKISDAELTDYMYEKSIEIISLKLYYKALNEYFKEGEKLLKLFNTKKGGLKL